MDEMLTQAEEVAVELSGREYWYREWQVFRTRLEIARDSLAAVCDRA